MFSYILKRIFLFIPTILLVSCLAFVLNKQVVSDPLDVRLKLQGFDENREGYQEAYDGLKKELHLDLPSFYISIDKKYLNAKEEEEEGWHYPSLSLHGTNNQYHKWINGFLIGNYGTSIVDGQPVVGKIWDAMKWTLLFILTSLPLAIFFSFLLGIYSGTHSGSKIDRWTSSILFAFYSIPKFWLATIIIIFFTTVEYGGWTNIFPSVGIWGVGGGKSFVQVILDSWEKLILPIMITVIPDIAYLTRLIRASIIEETNKEYIQTARSKGLSEKEIIRNHLIPNSLIPTITLLAGVIPSAISSSLVIEVIFNIPGVGRLMYESIQLSDWPVVFPIILLISCLTVVVFLLADILMAYLNPKIRLG